MAAARDLRTRIVETGAAHWAEHGAVGFSVARIAKHLGVSTASPYRHFADRDTLLVAVVAHAAEELALALTEAVEAARPTPVDRLRAAAAAWVRQTRRTRIGLADFLLPEVERADPALRAVCHRPVDLVRGLVGAVVEAADAHTDIDADRPAHDVLAVLHGYATVPAAVFGPRERGDLPKAAAAAVARVLPTARRARRDSPDPTSVADEQQLLPFPRSSLSG